MGWVVAVMERGEESDGMRAGGSEGERDGPRFVRTFFKLMVLCHNSVLIKIQLDATVCSLIYFNAKSLYMFRVSTAPIIRSTKNCNRSLRYRS